MPDDRMVPANDVGDAFWLPFTSVRQFREAPLLIEAAEGMHYTLADGRRVLDAMAGLWCVNAGHARPPIVEAIRKAAGTLDFVSSFRMSHKGAFAFTEALTALAPDGLDHAFFTNSGSEAVDTAIKMARAYQRLIGQGSRTKLIGRAKGYHGMGFGGLSVSGIGRHRRDFGPLLPETAHLPLPYDPARMRFPHGCPAEGAEMADALEFLLTVHDPATVAAVVIEPVTGSGGVYPPPQGYLKRIREICDRHGILLVFDEVITGFGRMGTPFAAQWAGVTPDLMTLAKGITNGAVPMGAVLAHARVFDVFMSKSAEGIEFNHGYTYSAHPLACAAGLATLEVYRAEGLFARAGALWPSWNAAAHALDGARNVTDVRTIGLLCAIDVAPRPGAAAGSRGADVAAACLEAGVLVRASGDMIVLSPPLIIADDEIRTLFSALAHAFDTVP
jgi:beta-alanine--pyruvate transaminase